MAHKHKGNGTTYAKKNLGVAIRVKQTSGNKWSEGVAYYDPMDPNTLYVTGDARFKDRFDEVDASYNGDELYDDVFNAVHDKIKALNCSGSDAIELTRKIMRKVQPKVEALNVKVKK